MQVSQYRLHGLQITQGARGSSMAAMILREAGDTVVGEELHQWSEPARVFGRVLLNKAVPNLTEESVEH